MGGDGAGSEQFQAVVPGARQVVGYTTVVPRGLRICPYVGHVSPRRSFTSPASTSAKWPTEPCHDPAAEKIRLFVVNLREALRLDEPDTTWTLRSLARHVGMDDTLLSDLIAGKSWPNSMTIAQLEVALDVALWPEHASR